MNKSIAIAICAICISVPVQAGTKAGTTLPMSELPTTQVVALTKKECINLGGRVLTDNVCSSGKTCRVNSANGDQHYVCLEAAN